MNNVLELNGLSLAMLNRLSFKTGLGISLKKDLKYFDKNLLLEDLLAMVEWYDCKTELAESALDYRIKSKDSILLKYEKYFPDHQCRKVFSDVLGFRAFCDSYDEVLSLTGEDLRIFL